MNIAEMHPLRTITLVCLASTLVSWSPSAAVAIRITKGPYLQNVTSTSVVIMWETNVPSNSLVQLGSTTDYGRVVIGPSDVTIHEVKVNNLDSITGYHYRVQSTETVSEDFRFRTAPQLNAPSTFAVIGDSCTNPDTFQSIAQAILNRSPDFILHTGDLVADGTLYDQWSTMFFTPARNLLANVSFFPCLGNQEGNSDWYYRLFSLPHNERWYSFDWGSAHFIALDSCGDSSVWGRESAQTRWLENDLASARAAKWKIVYFHHAPYSSGTHGSSIEHREAWEGVFSKYEVDLVFNGHDNTFERTYKVFKGMRNELLGLPYIVTGGGGAPLYDVTANDWTAYSRKINSYCMVRCGVSSLRVDAYDISGNLIDYITLTKDPTAIPDALTLLQESSTDAKLSAIRQLSELGSPLVAHAAASLVGHPDPEIRRALAIAFNRSGAPQAVEPSLRLLRNADPIIKREVASLLGKVGGEKTIDAAIGLLDERDAQTRIGAARTLSHFKVPKGRLVLQRALSDSEPLVRYYACYAFARIAESQDMQTFRDRLRDTSSLVRCGVVESLELVKNMSAVPLLIDTLGDPNARVRKLALASLKKITKEDFGLDVTKWKMWLQSAG